MLRLGGRQGGIRQIGAGLGTLDREVFEAIAESCSPLLDATMPGLSRAADHSKLWLAIGAAVLAHGGEIGTEVTEARFSVRYRALPVFRPLP